MSVPAVADRAAFARVTDALDAHGCAPKVRGDHLDARCPAHDDHKPSLTADWRSGPGRVLLCCQYGCTSDAVVAALGLTLADLYDVPKQRGTGSPRTARSASTRTRRTPAAPVAKAEPECAHRQRQTAEYTYTDAEGTITGWVIRRECSKCGEKSFSQARPGADGEREWKVPDERPLYRLPDVLAAITAGTPVVVVEGEKDADNGAAAGMVTTTNAMGAGKWSDEHTETLRGAHVVIVADRDAKGYGHAVKVGDALAGVAASVRVVRGLVTAEKADLSDHLAAGHGPAELEEIDPAAELAALDASASSAAAPALDTPDDAEPSSDEPVGTVVPFPRKGGGDGGAPSVRDEFPIPTTNGGQWTARRSGGRGIYRSGDRICDFPYVLEVVHRRTARGKREEFRLCLDPDGDSKVLRVARAELSRGEWGAELRTALPVDKKILECLATAIIIEGYASGEIHETTPGFDGAGLLAVPPADVMPEGYGQVADVPEDDARAGWAEIARRAAEHPKLALGLGTAAFAPFIGPLKRQPFVCHGAGDPRQGKTTLLYGTAALYGDPRTIVHKWSRSIPGLSYQLSGLGVLPAFFDELGGAGFTPAQLEEVVFTIAQRAQRTTATRYTKEAETSPPWDGTVFSTGNNSIVGQVSNPGVHARVIELTTPIIGPAESEEGARTAEWFTGREDVAGGALDRFHGWPLRWIRAVPVAEVVPLLRKAEQALPLPVGGVPRTVGQHLAGAIAGAELLDSLFGTEGVLAAAALAAAREHIDALGSEGVRDASEVLLDALRTSLREQPGKWPTRKLYEDMTGASGNWQQTSGMPGIGMDRSRILGIILEATDAHRTVMLSPKTARELCSEEGIDETVALRGLNGRNLLVISDSQRKAKKLQNEMKIAGKKERGYCVMLAETDDPTGEPEGPDAPPSGPQDGPAGGPGPDGPADAPQAPTGAFPLCRGCGEPMTHGDLYGDGLHATCDAPAEPDPTGGWGEGTIGAAMVAEHAAQPPAAPATPPAPRPAPQRAPASTPAASTPRPAASTAAGMPVFPKRPDQEQAYRERVAVLDAMDPADDSDETINTAASALRIIEAMTDDPGDDRTKDGPFAPIKFGTSAPFWTASLPDIAPPLIAHNGWGTFTAPSDYRGPAAILDRNAGHPSALSSLRVGHGALKPTGALSDASRPGYYKTVVHQWTRADLPSPMGNRAPGSEVWVTHERMRLLAELAELGPDWWPDAPILDSHTADRETSLRDLSQLIKHLRAHVIDTHGKDSVQWETIKEATNTKLIQIMMGSPKDSGTIEHWTDRQWFTKCRRTDWAHALHDKAAMNLFRVAVKLSRAGIPVLAVRHMDEIAIPADRVEEAITRELIKADEDGRTFGTFKTKDTEEWGA